MNILFTYYGETIFLKKRFLKILDYITFIKLPIFKAEKNLAFFQIRPAT